MYVHTSIQTYVYMRIVYMRIVWYTSIIASRIYGKLVDNFSHESDVTSLQDPFTSRPLNCVPHKFEEALLLKQCVLASSFPDLLDVLLAVHATRIQVRFSLKTSLPYQFESFDEKNNLSRRGKKQWDRKTPSSQLSSSPDTQVRMPNGWFRKIGEELPCQILLGDPNALSPKIGTRPKSNDHSCVKSNDHSCVIVNVDSQLIHALTPLRISQCLPF